MSNSHDPSSQPQPSPKPRLLLLLLSRTSIAVIALMLVGLAGGAWWLWTFVQTGLAPLVQKNLIQTFNRPVRLGRVERFSPFGVRFGQTDIPATSNDPDYVSLKALEVKFNPLQVLFTRTLHLDVTLVGANVFVQQDKQGRWIRTTVAAETKPGLINTQLDTVRLQNTGVVLVPYPKPGNRRVPFDIASLSGIAHILNQKQQLISYDLSGQPRLGGSFQIQGESGFKTNQSTLQLAGQNLLGADITRLVKLPVEIRSGRVNGNLAVQISPNQQQPLLSGTAGLKSVTAKFDRLPQVFNNTQGTLSFQGTQVALENVSSSFGKIPLLASGVLDTLGNFNVNARVPSVSLVNVEDTFNVKVPVTATGLFGANLEVRGPISAPVLLGTFANLRPVRLDRFNFSTIRSQLKFTTATSTLALKDFQVIPQVGGRITGGGTIALGPKSKTGFDARVSNIPGDAIARLYGVSPQIRVGTVSGISRVSGAINHLQAFVSWQAPQATYPASGQIQVVVLDQSTLLLRNTVLNVASGTVRVDGQIANGRFQAQAIANHLDLGQINRNIALKTPLSGQLSLNGSTASFTPNTISVQGSGQINVAGGIVTASNIQAAGGRFRVRGNLAQINPGEIASVPPALKAPLSGTFNLSGSTASFEPQYLALQGNASVNVAGGTVTALNLNVQKGQWQTSGTARGLQLGRILPQLPPQLQGAIDGGFNLSGSVTAFNLDSVQGDARGNLNVAGGTVTANNIQLQGGHWQAVGTASGIQLARLLPQAPSQFQGTLQDGKFNLSGSIAAISPQTVRGNASGSLGVAGGTVTANNIQLTDGRFLGSVAANQVNLGPLAQLALANRFGKSVPIPDVRGRLSANVDVAGSLNALNLSGVSAAGQLSLLNLGAGELNLDPVLDGDVNLAPGKGVSLRLAGANDKISLVLSPTYRPDSFLFQLGSAVATGSTKGDTLSTFVSNFPITIFKALAPLPRAIANQPVSGTLDANLAVNLNTYATDGNLAVTAPAIGTFRADQLTAQFRYANGGIALANGLLTQGPTRYTLAGSISSTANGPQLQATVKIAQAYVQSILTALQFYDIQDLKRGFAPPVYAKASAVGTDPVGLPGATLLTQLRRYSEIKALQQEQLAQQQVPLPPLADFNGVINGEISANGSLKQGVRAKFDLVGSNWQWGKYVFNPVVARGSFDNGVLTILPLRINSNLGDVGFVGQVGGAQESGQLRVRNFPISILNQFAKLPVTVTGFLNGSATLAGTRQNPAAIGEINLAGGTLNQKPINSASTSFSYNNARLNFGSKVVVDNSNQPIQIDGSIPYALPFAAVKPNSDQISLNVSVQDQGLALLNLLTNQVTWEGGQGQVQAMARGTLRQPVLTGTATVSNATIAASAFPAPLTNVTGTARFNGDRILVEGIQGSFSRGSVAASGVIPIFAPLSPTDPDAANPLTVTLNQLKLSLPGLYQGGASGNVIVTGSTFSPLIGGDVELAQGQVLLTKAALIAGAGVLSGNSNTTTGATKQLTPAKGAASGGVVPTFNNLQLTLGKKIAIRLPPILNFSATGSLAISGTLNDLHPQGTIRLGGGDLNLFTTQFVLARAHRQTVTFLPAQGLNPTLNLRLVAVVPEVTSVPTVNTGNSLFGTTENAQLSNRGVASRLGSFQTVRVEASVTGPASQIFNNLVLTSAPFRSREEIIGLLGGGFVQNLTGGNGAVGAANLAGSALLGNFQAPISKLGNALGLSELRVFPTAITTNKARNSTFGLAAEGSIDISGNLSGDVLRFLTPGNQPTQFGLSYQLTNQLRLRTSTDFSGDNNAEVEYQNRF